MSHIHSTQSLSIDVKPERALAILLMLFLHVGLIVALSQGLVRDIHLPNRDPSNVRVIEVPLTVIQPKVQPVTIGSMQSVSHVKELLVDPLVVETATRDDFPVQLHPTTTTDSRENGGAAVAVGARTDPRYPLTQPAYPPVSRRLGEEGTVELALYVLANGRVGDVRVERSSGFVRLDEAAAREAVRSWRLLPERINDVPAAGWHRIAVTFHLKN